MSVDSAAWGEEALEREAASPALLVGTLALATFAAWTIPAHRLGLGAALVPAGVAVLVLSARAMRLRPQSAMYGAFALVLAAMPAVRSAEWLIAVDLLVAAGLGALAVVGGTDWADMRRAPLAVTARSLQAMPFLSRGVRRVTAGRRFTPVLRGAVVGAALLLVFGGLFISADRAFAELARSFLLPEIALDLLAARMIVFVLIALAATGFVTAGPRFASMPLLGARRPFDEQAEEYERRPRRGLAPVEWVVALGLLDLLFLAFVLVQVTVLFAGDGYVLRTAGVTYAEYARQGFFQLLAVAGLTLGVVAAASRWAKRPRPRHDRILQALLGLLLLLTLVVLASALKRLLLYEDTFGFTRLRVSVHAVILWLAGVMVLVMAAAAVRVRPWLMRVLVAFTAASLIGFNAVNPDGFVASRNVDRYAATGVIDLSYLSALSPDAVPALARLPRPLQACFLRRHHRLLAEPDAWAGWNLGRERARSVLRDVPTDCST